MKTVETTVFQSHATRVLTLALLLFPVLAPDARAQLLFEDQGVELHGTARLELSEAGTCNVLESDTAYEEKQANHGAPMDIWRLDFSVRNGSGRWLDHLIARFQIESAWPDCTNWDVPTAYQLPQDIEWADSIGNIQESGRNVVSPGQTLTETRLFIVLRGDPEPRFSHWSMNFDFAAVPPPAGTGSPAASAQQPATAEQETVFWQSIADSTNPAMFEAYLAQFPNGVFRALAEARLAELRAPAGDRPAPTDRRTDSRGAADDMPDVPGWQRVGSAAEAAADARLRTRQSVDFGEDSSTYARDGECDDPRFEGSGMATAVNYQDRGADATDCRPLYEAGRIRLFGVDLDTGYIDFGDNSSEWARDGECDDPRFEGSGMDSIPLIADRSHDATDCRRLYDAGRIRLFGVDIGGVRRTNSFPLCR